MAQEKKQLRITQVRSVAGQRNQSRRILQALGLRKRHQTVVHDDTPQIRGMIRKVGFLVKVDELT